MFFSVQSSTKTIESKASTEVCMSGSIQGLKSCSKSDVAPCGRQQASCSPPNNRKTAAGRLWNTAGALLLPASHPLPPEKLTQRILSSENHAGQNLPKARNALLMPIGTSLTQNGDLHSPLLLGLLFQAPAR